MKSLLKITVFTLALISVLFISSCGSDDESGPSYEFINQNLQGTIDGSSYSYGEGTVEESTRDGELILSFDLFHSNEEFTDICDFFGFGDNVSVFFSTSAEVGLYELFLDFDSGDSQTVTLFNPNGAVNNIASIGAVEILTVTETEVTGRMDATLDGENTVNGNFTAVFCLKN